MTTSSLPRRYARALFEVAREEGAIDQFFEELSSFESLFAKNQDILETLTNDFLSHEDRISAMKNIAEASGCHPLLKNFLTLLIKKERLNLFEGIVREYRKFRDESNGIVRAIVEMPEVPDPQILQEIERILSQKLKKTVLSRGRARPEMIGGLILKVDHLIYDGSIRRELECMKDNMLKG